MEVERKERGRHHWRRKGGNTPSGDTRPEDLATRLPFPLVFDLATAVYMFVRMAYVRSRSVTGDEYN